MSSFDGAALRLECRKALNDGYSAFTSMTGHGRSRSDESKHDLTLAARSSLDHDAAVRFNLSDNDC